jgi:hypothetical protein
MVPCPYYPSIGAPPGAGLLWFAKDHTLLVDSPEKNTLPPFAEKGRQRPRIKGMRSCSLRSLRIVLMCNHEHGPIQARRHLRGLGLDRVFLLPLTSPFPLPSTGLVYNAL